MSRGAGELICDLPKPQDGTVAAKEAKLEGAADRIMLPVSHLSMLVSREVAEQVVSFLRNGRFQH
jgi:triacylglycerol lipase